MYGFATHTKVVIFRCKFQMSRGLALFLGFILLASQVEAQWGQAPARVRQNLSPGENWETVIKAFRTKAKTPAQHLTEYNADTKACVDGFKLLEEDKITVDRLGEGANNEFKNFSEILAVSKFASEKSLKHLKENSSRFLIDVDFHAGDVTARVGAVFCMALLDARIPLAEKSGASLAGWTLREISMNQMRANLAYPYFGMLDGSYSFKTLFEYVKQTRSVYANKYPRQFNQWVHTTAQGLRKHQGWTATDDAALIEQWKATLKDWANQLDALKIKQATL